MRSSFLAYSENFPGALVDINYRLWLCSICDLVSQEESGKRRAQLQAALGGKVLLCCSRNFPCMSSRCTLFEILSIIYLTLSRNVAWKMDISNNLLFFVVVEVDSFPEQERN